MSKVNSQAAAIRADHGKDPVRESEALHKKLAGRAIDSRRAKVHITAIQAALYDCR